MSTTDPMTTIKAANGSGVWFRLPGVKSQLWAATRAEAERTIEAALKAQRHALKGARPVPEATEDGCGV